MAGIVDLDVAFPRGRVTVERMHEESGRPVADILAFTHCAEIPVFDESETAWELVRDVAAKVLTRNGIAPDDVGQVIVAGSGRWDHPAWSPAAKVAAELGVDRAHCFEVTNFCNAAATAIQLGSDAIAAGRVRHCLVLVGEQGARGVDYTDPESVSMFNTGDCAVAVLLGADATTLDLLGSSSRTDPSWADYYVGEYDYDRVLTRRRGRRLNLPQTYLKNFDALTRQTLDGLGKTVEEVRWLLVNHSDRRVHERLLKNLGLPFERSVFNYDRLGHMGGGDPFIALADLRAEGRLRAGDLVLLATSGVGFSWSVTALEVSA